LSAFNFRPRALARCVAITWPCVCTIVAGCQQKLPPDEVSARIAAATGIDNAIQLDTVGGDIDVRADESASVLTLDAALHAALTNDPAIQAALARVRVALADAKQARLLPNPVLSVILRFPEGGGKTQVEAGLSADLLTLLQAPRRVDAADKRLRVASAEVLTAAIDLVASVQERYATAQSADAELLVLRERQRLTAKLLELAKSRFAVGESSRLDVITLDAERVSLDVEIAQAISQRRQERLALARLMGEPSANAEWQLSPWLPVDLAVANEVDWVRAALQHRPEIQAQRWELAALGDDVQLASAFDGAEVGVEAERDDKWAVGPSVSTPLPLFDWGQQRRAKAEAQRIEARHRLTQTQRQIVEDVRRAVESLGSAQSALRQVQGQLIPLSDQRVQQAEAAYTNGSADVTSFLLAQQDAQGARSKQIELQQKVSTELFRLQRAVGGRGVVVTSVAPHPEKP